MVLFKTCLVYNPCWQSFTFFIFLAFYVVVCEQVAHHKHNCVLPGCQTQCWSLLHPLIYLMWLFDHINKSSIAILLSLSSTLELAHHTHKMGLWIQVWRGIWICIKETLQFVNLYTDRDAICSVQLNFKIFKIAFFRHKWCLILHKSKSPLGSDNIGNTDIQHLNYY